MKKNIVIVSSVLFASFALVASAQTRLGGPIERPTFCGGIAAIRCTTGYSCKLSGTYPDAGGVCVKNTESGKPEKENYSEASSSEARRASSTEERLKAEDRAKIMRLENARRQVATAVKRLNAAIDRIQKLSDRAASRLDKLSAQGGNVTVSHNFLAAAKTKLDDARTQVAAIQAASATMVASSTPKQMPVMKNIERLVNNAAKTIQAAQHLVAQAISNIKPGENRPKPATSTATTTN